MSGGALKSALTEAWYLVVLFCAIALVVAYKLVAGSPEPVVPQTLQTQAGASGRSVAANGAVIVRQPPRQTEEEKARALIADYRKRLAEDPRGKDVPALLLATGNLCMLKLKDLKEAARNYELLIQSYPDWGGIAGVYAQLMTCYEQLDDKEGLRWLYKEMVEKFPPESNEYQYAQAKLNL